MRRRLGVWLAGVAFKIDPKLPEALVWLVVRDLAAAEKERAAIAATLNEQLFAEYQTLVSRIAQDN